LDKSEITDSSPYPLPEHREREDMKNANAVRVSRGRGAPRTEHRVRRI